MSNEKYLVSISVLAYQHKDYIKQCLDGILMQKTNFAYEIILGEDGSNDGTREICIDYAQKHPDKIKLFLRTRNNVIYISGVPTGRFNFIENLKAAKGKYIALCEGDDYWTDPLKLQKQIDFLEKNKDYNICFHKAQLLLRDEFLVHEIPKNINLNSCSYIDLLKHYNFITTASVVFRNQKNLVFPKWFYKIPYGDLGLYKLINKEAQIMCLPDIMSVYRMHDDGIYTKLSKLEQNLQVLMFYKLIRNKVNKEELNIIKNKRASIIEDFAIRKYPNNQTLFILYKFYLNIRF